MENCSLHSRDYSFCGGLLFYLNSHTNAHSRNTSRYTH